MNGVSNERAGGWKVSRRGVGGTWSGMLGSAWSISSSETKESWIGGKLCGTGAATTTVVVEKRMVVRKRVLLIVAEHGERRWRRRS